MFTGQWTKSNSLEMAIGPKIWETWNQLSYQVFDAMIREEQWLAEGENGPSMSNTWLCVPQLISNLACLTGAASSLNGPSETLRRELLNEAPGVESHVNMIRVIMNIIGEELRQWENALHSISKPGIFAVARRMIVHPKFTKSYAYNTFVTLNNLGVEVKIFDGSNEIIQWIQKSLKAGSVNTCPFELWRSGETVLKKEAPREAVGRDLLMSKSNQRCPIFAWASHFQITFKSGIFESEAVFTMSGSQENKGEEMYLRFHSEKPKMKFCSIGRTGILEVPTNSSNIFLYFVTDVERALTGPQLLDMIREVQKAVPETHTAYIPIWWSQEKVSNVAKGIKNALDAEPLFSHGGFGDLAMEDVEASSEYSRKLTSNIQHFDMVTVFHQPDTSNIKRIVLQLPPFNVAHITCPFTLVVYDNKKKMPVYFGRIVTPKVVNMKAANTGEIIGNQHKPGPKKWCRLI
ncbi:hypothetical protein RB195_011081 [Necator americanus]|uniref:Serpin domain-containing protein n=1 Tax=Necator americanus TaxID=51031 RepID=A0ABR1D101_NECAM